MADKKREKKDILTEVTMRKNAIARHRDALYALVEEINNTWEDADQAVMDLESAIQTLSQTL